MVTSLLGTPITGPVASSAKRRQPVIIVIVVEQAADVSEDGVRAIIRADGVRTGTRTQRIRHPARFRGDRAIPWA